MHDALKVEPLNNIVIQGPPQVYMRWDEQLTQNDVTHQLEPGEVRLRTRTGRLLNIFPDTHNLREGYVETTTMAAVIDETEWRVHVLPLKRFRVVPPQNSVASA